MLILFDRPDDISWELVGDGATIDSTLDASFLTDGRPGLPTRFSWLTGTQTTFSVLRLRGSWGSGPRQLRGCGLIGITLDAGQKIVAKGKRPADEDFTYDFGGNSASQRSARRADGSAQWWAVFDGAAEAVEGIEFALYNDVFGSATIGAGTVFDIGEAMLGRGFDCARRVQREWGIDPVDATTSRRGLSKQNWPDYRVPYDHLSIALKYLSTAEVFGDTSIAGSLAEVDAFLLGQQPCAVIPRRIASDGNLSNDLINLTALFGSCSKVGKAAHVVGDLWSKDYEFESNPVP